MLSVLCPQCKSAYRVDEARIPPQGGVITCKQCQTRIPLRPPATPPAEVIEDLTDADEVADADATVHAPAVNDPVAAPPLEPTNRAPAPVTTHAPVPEPAIY